MTYAVVIKSLETGETLKVYGEYPSKDQAERAAERRMMANMDLERYYADVETLNK